MRIASTMGLVRILYRLPLIGVSTLLSFVLWLATRPLLLVSRGAALRAHGLIVSSWGKAVTRILGVRIRIEGDPPQPPFFLVSNHLSYLDIPVLFTCLQANFLAKSEVARWPFIGPLARAVGTLFIDRSSRADLKRVIPLVHRTLDGGHGVVIFPEGTSSEGAEVLPFRSSLFEVPVQAGIGVRAAAVSYETPPDAPPARLSVCWWGDMDFMPHFIELLKLPRVDALIRFASVTLRAEDRRALSEAARTEVCSLFTPVTGTHVEAATCRT